MFQKLKKTKFSAFQICLFVLLLLQAVSTLLLLYWGVLTSLKTQSDFRRNNLFGFPRGMIWEWKWDNILTVVKNFHVNRIQAGQPRTIYIGEMLLYSVLYAVGNSFITTIVPLTVAYVCAKFDYKFSKVIYFIVIVTRILPLVGTAPAAITILKFLNIYDTFIGNYIQHFNFLSLYFLVFYAGFRGIPNDYAEAAYIDGASEWHVYLHIMIPLMRNMFFTVMLLMFIGFWNDYGTPLIYMPTHPTLALGVYVLRDTTDNDLSSVPLKMAGCTILIIPTLVLFLFFHKRIMGNISLGGIKG